MLMYANEVKTKEKIKITWDQKLTTTYIPAAGYASSCDNRLGQVVLKPAKIYQG